MADTKYRVCFFRASKQINLIIWILLCLSIVEIICIEFDCGPLKILSQKTSGIILQFSYAFATSFIFYFVVDVLHSDRAAYFGNRIIKRNVSDLVGRHYQGLYLFLTGVKTLSALEADKIDEYQVANRFVHKGGYHHNLQRLRRFSDDMLSDIDNTMKQSQLLNTEAQNSLDAMQKLLSYVFAHSFDDPSTSSEIQSNAEEIAEQFQSVCAEVKVLTKLLVDADIIETPAVNYLGAFSAKAPDD